MNYYSRSDVYRPAYNNSHSPTPTKHSFRPGDQNPTPSRTTDWDVFDKDLDLFFSRTLRAYELVRSYRRDCVRGTRWTRNGVEAVRRLGIDLHDNVFSLRRRQREFEQRRERGELEMEDIRDEVQKVRRYCEDVMDLINNLERIPLRQRMSRGNVEQKKG